jgi:hypothetical protein
MRDWKIEHRGQLFEPGCAKAIDSLLIFLDLLKTDAQRMTKLLLRHFQFNPPQPDFLADIVVGGCGQSDISGPFPHRSFPL